MNNTIFKLLIGFLLFFGITIAYILNSSGAPTAASVSPSTSSTSQTANTITYTNTGFTPASLPVKSGDTITIINNSNSSLQFDSDPHPDHTDNTELNVGTVKAGATTSFVAAKKGTHGFHNHLQSSHTGSITVE